MNSTYLSTYYSTYSTYVSTYSTYVSTYLSTEYGHPADGMMVDLLRHRSNITFHHVYYHGNSNLVFETSFYFSSGRLRITRISRGHILSL